MCRRRRGCERSEVLPACRCQGAEGIWSARYPNQQCSVPTASEIDRGYIGRTVRGNVPDKYFRLLLYGQSCVEIYSGGWNYRELRIDHWTRRKQRVDRLLGDKGSDPRIYEITRT